MYLTRNETYFIKMQMLPVQFQFRSHAVAGYVETNRFRVLTDAAYYDVRKSTGYFRVRPNGQLLKKQNITLKSNKCEMNKRTYKLHQGLAPSRFEPKTRRSRARFAKL